VADGAGATAGVCAKTATVNGTSGTRQYKHQKAADAANRTLWRRRAIVLNRKVKLVPRGDVKQFLFSTPQRVPPLPNVTLNSKIYFRDCPTGLVTAPELMAIFGWDTIKEAEKYTSKADQRRSTESAMHILVSRAPTTK
jgi:hypothetical protein